MARTQTLTNHDAIREWAEVHGATPALRRASGRPADSSGLAFDFHQTGGEELDRIDWDKWFERLDSHNLAVLVEHNIAEQSNTHEFVPRSSRRVKSSAARRKRSPAGGNQSIGGRARSAENAPTTTTPLKLSNPLSYEPEGSRRVPDDKPQKRRTAKKHSRHHSAPKSVWGVRSSGARRKSNARRPQASPRKSSSRSGRSKGRR